jgi:uncharacterized protein YbaP (TraB family)
MKKSVILFLLFYFICTTIVHAQKLPSTLLWKISGNGLQQPSYLYGTFHLTDEKLFNLGDSLYKAIENSQGFAIEVNPDDMMPFIIDMVKQEIKNSRSIKEMLGEKDFKKYSPSLSKKLKKPADDITTQDIFREKNKWVEESFQNGKMSAFLDAYLFDIARREGKWMGGVEDMEDQKGLLDNLVDESDIKEMALNEDQEKSKTGLDKLMEIYLKADLNTIDSLMNFTDSAYRDALLVRRNKKMAMRMDSLSRVRTMVFAVGAAHLPGEQGLISLLRSKGFTVDPVFYSKQIKPGDYKVREVDIPWVNVDDPGGYYKVQMPGKPGDIELFGLLDMKMYFDIFKSTSFLVTSINYPYEKKGIDSMIETFAQNIFKEKKPENAQSITINGIAGKEMEKTDNEGYKHGYILSRNNTIYMAVGFAKKNDQKGETDVNKFLKSFHPHEVEPAGTEKPYTYTDSALAFSIELPDKPKSGDDLVNLKTDKTIKSNLMVSVDQKTGAYLLFGVNRATAGYSIANDSSTLANIREGLKNKYATIISDTVYIKNNHLVLECNGTAKKVQVNMRAYYEFRGNRWYALVAMYDGNRQNISADRFFKSFKLLDFPVAQWEQKISEDSLLTAWVPSPIKYLNTKDSGETSSSIRYETYDSTRSDTYVIIAEALGKYYWRNSDTTFWNKIVKNISSYTDTLLSRKNVTNGNINGVEVFVKEKGSQNIKRREMFLFGDTLYTLSTTQHEENINDNNVNNFFENFRFRKPAPVTTIYKSKASLLLHDLSAADSATKAEATHALRTAPFDAKDLPLLHEAVLKKYTDSDDYKSCNEIIADAIIDLKDSSSLLFAKNNYSAITESGIKSSLLDIISSYKTKENYAALTGMMLKSLPLKQLSYEFINNIKDSGTLAATMFPAILPLLKDTITGPAVIDIAENLIDSNLISFTSFEKYQQQILQLAAWRYKKLKTNDDEGYSYGDDGLIALLGRFNTAASNAMLQRWLTIGKNYLSLKCIKVLAVNKQIISQKPILKLATDKSYRVDLYNELKKIKKQTLFPKQYLTQQSFAESIVYNAATEDDDEPSALTLLAQKIILFKGKKSRFFFYKITLGDEDKTYRLACAGPFDTNLLKLSPDKATGALYYKEDYDPLQLKQQIDALIKDMESWYKQDE